MIKKPFIQIVLGCVLLLLTLAVCIAVGSVWIALPQVIKSFLGLNADAAQVSIVTAIRTPRVLCGALAGAALACTGVIMQGVFSNPLADPGILGVSSGACMGALFAIAGGFASFALLPLSAFLGAMFSVVLILGVAKFGRAGTVSLIMAGMAISTLCNAATSILLTLANQYQVSSYIFWTMGGLANRRWEHVQLLAPATIALIGTLAILSPRLDVLLLGDEPARALGMRPALSRMILIALSSILSALVVSVTGPIGFVGLIVPHVARMLFGPSHRHLCIMSALLGGVFLPLCDMLVRLIGSVNGVELSVGIITALLGAPFFLILLVQKGRSRQ